MKLPNKYNYFKLFYQKSIYKQQKIFNTNKLMIFFNPFHINTFEEKNSLLSDPFEDYQSFQTNGIIPQLDPNYNNGLNSINLTHNADDIIPNSNEVLEEGSNKVLEEGSNKDLEEEIDGRADTLRKNIKRKVLEYSMEFINENITNKNYRIKKNRTKAGRKCQSRF